MNLVYLAPVPWSSFTQRSHQFVKWCHRRFNAEVLWIDPYPTRFPAWKDLRRLAPGWDRIAPEPRVHGSAWLTVARPPALPIEPLTALGAVNGLLWRRVSARISEFLSAGDGVIAVGKPSELAVQVLQRHRAVRSLFDAMDDFPAFYEGRARRAMELRTSRIASLVARILVSSTALIPRFRDFQSKSELVSNAFDADDLPPIESTRRQRSPPVLGYVGTIGHWFDWSLVRALAQACPLARIRLIGPVHAGPTRALPPNVELLPARGHGAAIQAMQGFAAGLIPFRDTELTRAVDPIKYYEYRALGLPVLSSRFGEMSPREREPGVFLVEAGPDLASTVQSALGHRYDGKEIRAFREANSWTARFDAGRILPPEANARVNGGAGVRTAACTPPGTRA